MAININWKLVSDKEARKLSKPKVVSRNTPPSLVWQTVWFLYALDWYQGVVVSKVDDEHYLVDATCTNIHKKGEMQQSIQPVNKLTIVDDDF